MQEESCLEGVFSVFLTFHLDICCAGSEEECQQQQQLERLLAAAAEMLPVAQQGLATCLDQTDGPALTLNTSTAGHVCSCPLPFSLLLPLLSPALASALASALALALK